jgi:FkbM family methyltransferase
VNNKTLRPIAFIIASSNHGTMIVNRNDYHMVDKDSGYGVGYQLLNTSSFDQGEVDTVMQLLVERRRSFGDGVVAIDLGANIGVHTIEWSKLMYGWGSVIAVEAQERLFYALAGNVAMNNCFNAKAIWGAIGDSEGFINVPAPDYRSAGSFGSVEIIPSCNNEFIGQVIDYSPERTIKTRLFTLDSLNLSRIDLIKIDIEGMEISALYGGMTSIEKFKPIMIIERVKVNELELKNFLIKMGYMMFEWGINLIAIHQTDDINQKIIISNTR